MSNWIKTKDKLPKEGERVLVDLDGFIQIGFYLPFLQTWRVERKSYKEEDIIAWCPILEYDLKD